jgi:Sushi repeat (SCR repeat)
MSTLCTVNACHPPPFAQNAVAEFTQKTRTVHLTCERGYRFSTGLQTAKYQCDKNGAWMDFDRCLGELSDVYIRSSIHLVDQDLFNLIVVMNHPHKTREL